MQLFSQRPKSSRTRVGQKKPAPTDGCNRGCELRKKATTKQLLIKTLGLLTDKKKSSHSYKGSHASSRHLSQGISEETCQAGFFLN